MSTGNWEYSCLLLNELVKIETMSCSTTTIPPECYIDLGIRVICGYASWYWVCHNDWIAKLSISFSCNCPGWGMYSSNIRELKGIWNFHVGRSLDFFSWPSVVMHSIIDQDWWRIMFLNFLDFLFYICLLACLLWAELQYLVTVASLRLCWDQGFG